MTDYTSNQTLGHLEKMAEEGYLTPEQEQEMWTAKLEGFKAGFSKMRDDWVRWRAQSGVENRWRTSLELYEGKDAEAIENTLANSLQGNRAKKGPKDNRSKVVVNIVRPKVDQAIARMCEILLPVDDRNWGIKPTPVPQSVSKMLGDNTPIVDEMGNDTGLTPNIQAQRVMEYAKRAAAAMETEIDDVLTQCNYNGEQRKVIENGVKLGTGCLLGPFPTTNAKRTWIPNPDGSMSLQISSDMVGASMSADPWDIFTDPACGNDHQRGSGFFHRRFVTKKEIRALAGVEGYDEAAIRKVLREKPTRTTVAEGRVTRNMCEEESYEMWLYYGEVDPVEMELLSESMCAEDQDPLVDVTSGVIIMVGETVIGAMESWIVDGSLPLDIWNWRKDDKTPQGHSLPEELESQQRVIISAWRQVMDNGKITAGGQIVINKKLIAPQDGNYDIYPNKVWLGLDDTVDVTKAMHVFQFANNLEAMLKVSAAAMQFADQETSMPQILGGEKGTAPETVGGMVMLFNNANVVLRYRVKLYDDDITKPHIGRHFDWQMAYNPKQEIKGDMQIDARGSTALLEKDIQNQATLNLSNVTSNPRYNGMVDPKKELKVLLKAFRINPDDVMFPDDKIDENLKKAAQAQPQDPRIVTAQLALQGKQMDIADRQEQRAADMQLAQGEQQLKGAQIAYNIERERAEGEQGQVQMQMDRELAIAKLQQDGILTKEEIASKERISAINIDSKHQLFNAEAALRVSTGEGI